MLRIFTPSNSGTITNLKGIHLADMTGGSSTNYAIYSEGGNSYFADNIGIGTTSTSSKLNIFDSYSTVGSKTSLGVVQTWSPSSAPGTSFPTSVAATAQYDSAQSAGGFMTNFRGFSNVQGSGSINVVNVDLLTQNTGTADITNVTDISIRSAVNSGGGSIGTYYGLRIGNQTAATTNYSIYSDGGMMYHAGNVGIGMVTPAVKLHISGSSESLRIQGGGTTGANSTGYISFYDSNGSTRYGFLGDASSGDTDLYFRADSTRNMQLGAGGATTLYLNSTGNIGVGTTTTTQRLTVSGSVDASIQFLGQASDSVSAPSFSWTSDTNTGMYRPAADTLAFVTGAAEEVRILSNGNVGIGSTAPGNLLDINTTSVSSGIALDNREAITGYSGDNFLRLNQSSQFSSGVYTPGNLRTDGTFTVNGTANINGTANVTNLECTDCIDTGDLKTATGNTSGTGDRQFAMADYGFFPNFRKTAGGNVCALNAAIVADDGTTVGTMRIHDCGTSTTVVRWRYVTASRDPEIFAWFDLDKGIITEITRVEFASDTMYPSEPVIKDGLIPVQATVFDDELLTADIEDLRRNYTFSRYEKPENLSSSDELMQIVQERATCLQENPDHPSYCVVVHQGEGVYFGKLVRSPQATETWAALEEEMNQANDTTAADLAEVYNGDEDIEAGDIVVVKSDGSKMLEKSAKEYDSNALGAVSTSPGLVLGEASQGNVTLALSGRVPVKVSDVNGEIKAGDKITTSAIPGVGMRSSRAGVVIGTALEDFNPEDAQSCEDNSDYKCGEVLTFMSIMSYDPTYDLRPDDEITIQEVELDRFEVVLQKAITPQAVSTFMKSVIATLEAGLIQTQKLVVQNSAFIRFLNVEGITINGVTLADYIGLVSSGELAQVDQDASGSAVLGESTATMSAEVADSTQNQGEREATASAAVYGEYVQINDSIWKFLREVVFGARARFLQSVEFLADVTLRGTLRLSKESAGTVVIPQGVKRVKVAFEREYASVPVVYLTEKSLITGKVIASEVTTKHFILELEHAQESSVTVHWLAILAEATASDRVELLPELDESQETAPAPSPSTSGDEPSAGSLDSAQTGSAESEDENQGSGSEESSIDVESATGSATTENSEQTGESTSESSQSAEQTIGGN